MRSYSINGQLLEQLKEDSLYMVSPLVAKDISSIECLIYGNDRGGNLHQRASIPNIKEEVYSLPSFPGPLDYTL